MIPLCVGRAGELLSVLCLGAHSDDIEIGAGGTILSLIEQGVRLEATWCVASATGRREAEARASATDFLTGAEAVSLEVGSFDDGFFPGQMREIKEWLASIRSRFAPDIVLTHRCDDAHQDHRTMNEITWNLFRDHLVLEYEIPKWDGDIGRPDIYVPLSREGLEHKVELLLRHFGSQRSKDWFDAETFRGMARLRGMECRAPDGFAEAFTLKKACLSFR
ncbi:MAG: PIG-L family deacetylase [Hyphomicrobiales bacterium]|nr:PIG-L family deacetylase [Hyphomicrobiales bacterium]